MTAIRTARAAEGKFVQIANAALQDRRLSGLARGVLAFVISLPTDHHLTAEWIEQQFPEGRRRVRAALGELQRCGYYQRTRTSGGRSTWEWEQVISDSPMFAQVAPGTENPSSVDQLASSQVSSSDRFSSDEDSSDEGSPDEDRSDKYLTREDLNTSKDKDEKSKAVAPQARPVAGGPAMASRRAHASGASARLFSDQEINDGTRFAIAAIYGETWNKTISDEEAVMLFRLKAPKSGRVTSVTAYMTKIFSDTPALDTLLSQLDYDGDGDDYGQAHDAPSGRHPTACPQCFTGDIDPTLGMGLCADCTKREARADRERIINGETPRHVIPNTVVCPRCEASSANGSGICSWCEVELEEAKAARPPVPVEGWNVSILEAVQTALYVVTGTRVGDEWAAKVADHILGDAKGKVTAPKRYITTTISQDPNPARFLPTKVAA